MIGKTIPFSALTVALAMACVCQAEPVRAVAKDEKPAAKDAPLVHVVIFRIKKDAPEGEIDALIADCRESLTKIPAVKGLKVGRPAEKGTAGIAKTDFDVGLLVLFADADGLKTYSDHELHRKFVEKHGKFFVIEKLDIFDFQDQAKK